MKLKERFQNRIMPYWQAILDILKYQIVTKICIGVWIFLLGRIAMWALKSTGRVAVTSGDFKFIFTSWQGILLILVALGTLFVYVAFDLNTKIIFSAKRLKGEEDSVWHSMKEGFLSIRRFFCANGVGVIIYVALVAPLLGFGMSISLTEGFYIPTFISSVIESTPIYLVLVAAAMIAFFIIGIRNMFILHGVVLDKMPVKEAGTASKALMRKHWKNYLWQNIQYILLAAAAIIGVILVLLVIPLLIVYALPLPAGAERALTIFFCIMGSLVSALAGLFVTPFYVMKMTELYYTYKDGEPVRYRKKERKKHPYVAGGICAVCAAVLVAAVVVNFRFDELFPREIDVGIIAHRGGGNEGPENTVKGLEIAAKAGAAGSEIDIQRTSDGSYVINHDTTFERVAGDKRKPEEMTLAEVRELSVDGEPVPTFEEMLEASRDKLILFVELKGSTADQQMADDAVRIIKEAGMEDQAVLISLKYDLINYIETNYPEIQTGYLTWVSFGNTAALNCDYLGLEEESATFSTIEAVHEQGKSVLVWTANDEDAQKHFLLTDIDGLITDNVVQAERLITQLEQRTDLERIVDRFLGM